MLPSAACAPPSPTASSHSGVAPKGERTIERLLSVDQTCRLQRRSLYGYPADALAARARGDRPRSDLTGFEGKNCRARMWPAVAGSGDK